MLDPKSSCVLQIRKLHCLVCIVDKDSHRRTVRRISRKTRCIHQWRNWPCFSSNDSGRRPCLLVSFDPDHVEMNHCQELTFCVITTSERQAQVSMCVRNECRQRLDVEWGWLDLLLLIGMYVLCSKGYVCKSLCLFGGIHNRSRNFGGGPDIYEQKMN